MTRYGRRVDRRRLLLAGVGIASTAWLAACGSEDEDEGRRATPAVTSAPAAAAATAASDLNAQGWPRSIGTLSIGLIPLEDRIAQTNTWKPVTEFVSARIGVPIDLSITTNYAALVLAQKNKQVGLGYYGPLSFLLAEQQFGAVPVMVDSNPATNQPGSYNSLLIAGKDSGIARVADIKGKDFAFVDPASTSGNLVPRAMLLEEQIDPAKDVKGRFAGNHANVIIAVAKGQVPVGGTNTISLEDNISKGVIKREDVVVLKTSAPIPNGPFAVHPDFDKRALVKLQESFGAYKDPAALKALALTGPLIPVDTSLYNPIRQLGKLLDLKFDDKGNPLPQGG